MRTVQSFLSPRGAVALVAALFATGPASAITFDSAMDDARDIAVTTGGEIAVFAQRILAGDMMAIKGAAFGLSGFIALIGLWLLLLRAPREEAIVIAVDEEEQEPLILHPPSYTPAQPAPARPASSGEKRPTRLLEAVAAARAQYDIAVAERQGKTLV